MGRKVHPIGFRLKINKTWEGRWYAEGEEYVNNLHQDFALRELVRREAPRGIQRQPHKRRDQQAHPRQPQPRMRHPVEQPQQRRPFQRPANRDPLPIKLDRENERDEKQSHPAKQSQQGVPFRGICGQGANKKN